MWLFPRQPAVALGAVALLVAMQAPTANAAAVSNDALVMPLAVASCLAAMAFLEGPNPRRAVLLGTAVGVGFLTKGSMAFTPVLFVGAALRPR
ncbi:MAG: hypothetical protein C4344_04645 [Acidimicrobiia bacterium]